MKIILSLLLVSATPSFAADWVYTPDWSFNCQADRTLNCENNVCGLVPSTQKFTVNELEVSYSLSDLLELKGFPEIYIPDDKSTFTFSVNTVGKSDGVEYSKRMMGTIELAQNKFTLVVSNGNMGVKYYMGSCQ